jgi:hypothetical protein
MATFLEDIDKIIEADEITPEENVGDAPVQEDLVIKIAFTDLSDSKQSEVKEKLMKDMKATDEISKNNVIKTLNSTPIFDGSLEAFRTQLGIENI